MTRPTEKQLAEALEIFVYSREPGMEAYLNAQRLLSAYRSAQQAEAGAAGDRDSILRAAVAAMPHTNPLVAEDLIEGFTMHTEADDIVAIWQAGRQQGMEQARADQKCPRHGAWMCVACRRGEAPAASSAQEPANDVQFLARAIIGEFYTDEPSKETLTDCAWKILEAGSPAIVARARELHEKAAMPISDALDLAFSESAPARMAGAAQGEAVATLHDDGCFTWKRDEFRRKYDRERVGWRMDVYAHPQAQVERKPSERTEPMSEEEIAEGAARVGITRGGPGWFGYHHATRAWERAHGIGIPTASTASDEGSV